MGTEAPLPGSQVAGPTLDAVEPADDLDAGLAIEAETGAMFEDPEVVARTVERLDAFARGER